MTIATQTTPKIPWMTGSGTHVMTADHFGIKPNATSMIPALMMAILLATPVIAIIPALEEYPVIGVPPKREPTKQPIPSPKDARFTAHS